MADPLAAARGVLSRTLGGETAAGIELELLEMGAKGSERYESFRNGTMRYWTIKAVKP